MRVQLQMALKQFAVAQSLGCRQQQPAAQQFRDQFRHFVHQPMMIEAKPIPFQQSEFRIVAATRFAIAKDLGHLIDAAAACR